MQELFKDIIELDCQFSISNFGRVIKKERKAISKSGFRTIKEGEPLFQDNGKGYKQLYISLNSKRSVFYVHRLVADYFKDNPFSLPEVNHLDGDKSNNHVDNIEWVTRKGNKEHAVKNGLIPCGEDCSFSKLTEDQVRAIRRLYRMNPKFNKLKLSKKLNVSDATIHKIIKNQRWKHINI